MATQTYFFTGATRWAKVRKPDEKYETYQVPLYLDETALKQYKDSGLQLKIKEDETGKFVVFKRKHAEFNSWRKEHVTNGPPAVKIKRGSEYVDFPDGLIGNGSIVTCRVEAYDTPKRGPGTKGHRLIAVAVEKLVEYNPDAAKSEAAQSVVEMPF